jgi:hypothetical protein
MTQPKIKSHIQRASGAMGDKGNIAYSSLSLAGDNKNRKKNCLGQKQTYFVGGGEGGGGVAENGGRYVAGE